MLENKPYLLMDGLNEIAQNFTGTENIFLGIKPYGFHAGNKIPFVVYPMLLCKKMLEYGKEPRFSFFIFINDWEQDGFDKECTDMTKFPFNVYPRGTTYQFSKTTEVSYWTQKIVDSVLYVKSLFPKVQIKCIKNSEMRDMPYMKNVVLRTIQDPSLLSNIMKGLGANITYDENNEIHFDCRNINSCEAISDKVNRLRASYYFLGALLGRFKKAKVNFPGGCNFGTRPIDQHIKGFEALGAKVQFDGDIISVEAQELVGTQIFLDVVSVGATVNIMLASVRAKGITTIENAAKEPHVVDVANFLNVMGANIKGAGTDRIKIKGVSSLKGNVAHSIIPDMIEAGTYMLASAITNGDVLVKNIIPKHLEPLTAKLTEMNVEVEEGEDFVRVRKSENVTPVNIKTSPYPGFPTDLHPQMSVFLTRANGISRITEGIWELRFQYVDELKKMGAHINLENRTAVIEGGYKLKGEKVIASDLRAGAALVLAGLIADGKTEVYNTHYIDRGYERLEEKLAKLGAKITRVRD